MDNTIIDDLGIFRGKKIRKQFPSFDRIFPQTKSRNASKLTCTPLEVATNICEPYIVFSFMSSNKKLTVIRTYKSITRTLSEIGGINSICFLIFYYITILFTRKTKRQFIIEKVFPFLKQNQFLSLIIPGSKIATETPSKNKILNNK